LGCDGTRKLAHRFRFANGKVYDVDFVDYH